MNAPTATSTPAPATTKPGDIRIKRDPKCPAHRTVIEPADKGWILWVSADGKPSLWLAVDVPADDVIGDDPADLEPGKTAMEDGVELPTIRGYMPASLMYEIDPSARADFEREAIEACGVADDAPATETP